MLSYGTYNNISGIYAGFYNEDLVSVSRDYVFAEAYEPNFFRTDRYMSVRIRLSANGILTVYKPFPAFKKYPKDPPILLRSRNVDYKKFDTLAVGKYAGYIARYRICSRWTNYTAT